MTSATTGLDLDGGRKLQLLQALIATVTGIDVKDDDAAGVTGGDADVPVGAREPATDLMLVGSGVPEPVLD